MKATKMQILEFIYAREMGKPAGLGREVWLQKWRCPSTLNWLKNERLKKDRRGSGQ